MPNHDRSNTSPTRQARRPRWRRRPERRPDEIAGAGLRLFSTRGYLNVTVDDIAREAGVTKGAVYHHFAGKEDLLVAAVELHFRRTFSRAGTDEPPPTGATAKARIKALLWAGWQFWHSDEFQGLFRLVLGETGSAIPAVRQRFLREGPHRGWQTLATLIRDGQEAGEFRRDLDAAAAAKLIACGLVLQIMLASLDDSKSRADRAEFNRAFKVVEQTLAGCRPC
jgi:TetR/AcrR family acrAB operon transcriptional repressor